MAKSGQLTDVRCEMPNCYCPDGRKHFVERANPMPEWAPNVDHYPKLRAGGGHLTPDNVRLSHTWCNQWDQGFRKMVGPLLAKGLSLVDIAKRLNDKKIKPPTGYGHWTARLVRSTYIK
jgi:hypothetical protein